MRESRLYKRVLYKGPVVLTVEDRDLDLETVNLSKGGACLKVTAEFWPDLEELSTLDGVMTVQEQPIKFSARVCWSSSDEEFVFFGVAFKAVEEVHLNKALEDISIVQDQPEINGFNL